jgi:hypothetical protein
MWYHITASNANCLDHPTFTTNSRKTFARAAVDEAFRPQDTKATLKASFLRDGKEAA